MEFKDRFRELRLSKGLSQVEMAERLKISKSAVGAYETGDRFPTLEGLAYLAEYFGVSMGWLAGDEVSKTPTAIEQRLLSYWNKLNSKGKEQLMVSANAFLHVPEYTDENSDI